MKKIITKIMIILVCISLFSCGTKKSVENKMHEESTSTLTQSTDTTEEEETIIITETKVNDSTTRKEIKAKRKQINHGLQKSKRERKETDSILQENTNEMAARKQEIKDIKKYNKDLKKAALKKQSIWDKIENQAELMFVIILLCTVLIIIKKVKK